MRTTAVRLGNMDMATLLIEEGASVNLDGINILSLAAGLEEPNHDMVDLLLANGADTSKVDIHLAAEIGHVGLLEKVLEGGADIIDQLGDDGNVEAMEILITKGADINFDNDGQDLSPIELAVIEGSLKAVELLIQKGSQIDQATAGNIDKKFGKDFMKEERADLLAKTMAKNVAKELGSQMQEFKPIQSAKDQHSKQKGLNPY